MKVNHIVQLAPVIAHLQAIAVKINVRRRYGKMHPSKQLLPYTTLENVNYNRDCNIYAVHVLIQVPKINVSPEKCLAEPFYTGLQRYVKVTCLFPDESLYNVKNNQKRCSLRAPLQPRSYGCGSLNSKKKKPCKPWHSAKENPISALSALWFPIRIINPIWPHFVDKANV